VAAACAHVTRTWQTSTKLGTILNVVNAVAQWVMEAMATVNLRDLQQAGVVKNLGYFLDDVQLVGWDLHPNVEGGDELGSYVFAWHLSYVMVRLF
jgi:hypothetical protein